jgi:hypothetical protein
VNSFCFFRMILALLVSELRARKSSSPFINLIIGPSTGTSWGSGTE